MKSPPFHKTLAQHNLKLQRLAPHTLQVNVGFRCNLSCKHCHVSGGPTRPEMMTRETMDDVIDFANKNSFLSADITGGAPELVPDINYLVRALSEHIEKCIFRSNLTLLLRNEHNALFQLLRKKKISLVASFPSTNAKQADSQRGEGIWERSIATLKELNREGYGIPGTGLELNLVANPTGAFMPVDQCRAEAKFRTDLAQKWGIQFTNLYTFANIPLGRYRAWLEATKNHHPYMKKLTENFNPATVEGLMCRTLISVDWQGYLYDCDFNLAAGLPHTGVPTHITSLDNITPGLPIITDNHCYGCTAGAGFT